MTREEMLNECVSRDKAIVQLNHLKSDWDDDWNIAIRKCIETIKSLPSATPQPKMGHWEWVQYGGNPKIGNWHCSECRTIIPYIPHTLIYKWCPMCGAKMSEIPTGAEGSDKE